METRSKARSVPSSVGDDTGFDDPTSMSQPRDQVTETQTQIQALQSQITNQQSQMERILSLLEDRRPGRHPESTAQGRDTTPTVPPHTPNSRKDLDIRLKQD